MRAGEVGGETGDIPNSSCRFLSVPKSMVSYLVLNCNISVILLSLFCCSSSSSNSNSSSSKSSSGSSSSLTTCGTDTLS